MTVRKPLPTCDAPEPIMRQAGAWLARRDRGFTAAEEAEFDRWVFAHPDHAAAVAQLGRTMTDFDRLRELAPTAGGVPDPDFFSPRPSRRWLFPSIAATGLAAALALVFWPVPPPSGSQMWHYATASTGYERATLVDGSTLELNANTTLEVEFTAGERRVRLSRGEAHFQVAKDSTRPFVVKAGTVAVCAVGTAFNVRLEQAGVEVLVTEGEVRVEPPEPAKAAGLATVVTPPEMPLLAAGQRMLVSMAAATAPAKIAAVSPEEIERALAWKPRVAEFRKTPLSEIVAEFNRQNRQKIVIGDPELAVLRVGGNFRTDQPDAFVRLLETSFGVKAERTDQGITLRVLTAPKP